MNNVTHITKFVTMQDLRQFAEELNEAWEFEKIQVIDRENKWWSDEIELEYFQDCMDKANLQSWEVDYVLHCLGY